MKIQTALDQLGFTFTHDVSKRHSIADLFPLSKESRCGIYLLHFDDGMYYVGQAVDVVRRFTQHKKVHNDIKGLSFKRIKKDNLDHEESRVIRFMESDFLLRNISLASFPDVRGAELDDLIPQDAQSKWLDSYQTSISNYDRVNDTTLRGKTLHKYKIISTNSYFIDIIAPVMQEYIFKCTPEHI